MKVNHEMQVQGDCKIFPVSPFLKLWSRDRRCEGARNEVSELSGVTSWYFFFCFMDLDKIKLYFYTSKDKSKKSKLKFTLADVSLSWSVKALFNVEVHYFDSINITSRKFREVSFHVGMNFYENTLCFCTRMKLWR